MCVIAVVPKQTRFPSFAQLHAMWQSNPHGAGFMWAGRDPQDRTKPALKIQKGLMTFEQLKRALKAHRREFLDSTNTTTVDFAIHFRIASAGGVSLNLTHPFQAGADVGLMHNGHISELAFKDPTKPEDGKLVTASQPISRGQQQTLACLEPDEPDLEDDEMFELLLDKGVAHGLMTPLEAIERVNKYEPKKHGDPFIAAGRLLMRKLSIMDESERAKVPKLVDILGLTPEQIQRRPVKAKQAAKPVEPTPTESDTSRLAQILSRLPRGWQRNDVCLYMVQESFLGWDRVVLFDSNGLAKIIGENRGTWHGKGTASSFWTSNDHWIERRHVSGQALVNAATTRWPSTTVVNVSKSATNDDTDDHEAWRNLPDDVPLGFYQDHDGDDETAPGTSADASVQ